MGEVKQAETETNTTNDVEREAELRKFLNANAIATEDDVPEEAAYLRDAEPIRNTAGVAHQIRNIQQIDNDIASFKRQADEAAEFYKQKIDGLKAYQDSLKQNCGGFLKLEGLRKLATHAGTIFFSKKKTVTYPEDAVLLKFIDAQPAEFQADLCIVKPSKTALKQYIESTGKTPEGYLVTEGEGISIRKVAL